MNIKIPRLPYAEDRIFGFLFLSILIIPLAFNLFNYESFEIPKYGLLFIFIGAALLALSLVGYSKTRVWRGSPSLFVCLGLFWLWCLAATVSAWDNNYSFFGFYTRFTNGFLFYSLWAIALLLLSLLDKDKIRTLLKTLVLCSGLIGLWGILQSLGFGYFSGFVSELFNHGVPSFLGNADFSSMFMAAAVPLTVYFLYRAEHLRVKVYYFFSLFLQLWTLVILASRGALLALAAGLITAIVLAVLFRKQALKLAGLFLAAAILAFVMGHLFVNITRPDSVTQAVALSDANVQNRLAIWGLSADSIVKRPLLGVGLGNFELMFEHDRQGALITSGFFDDAHNLALELAVTGGLPLLLLFLGLVGLSVWESLRRLKATRDLESIAVAAAIAAWLVASCFTPVAIACYLMLAVLISAGWSRKLDLGEQNFMSGKIAKRSVLLLGIIVLAYGVAFLTAEGLFFSGVRAYNDNDFGKAYDNISLAIRLNPVNRLYYVYQAGSAIRLGQPADKISSMLAALEKFNPTRAFSYVQAASLQYLLLYQTKQPMVYKQAIYENLNKALTLDPYSASNFSLISQYALVFGDTDLAKMYTMRGLAEQPADFDTWIFLAKIYQVKNDRVRMVDALNQALKIQPDNIPLIRLILLTKRAANLQMLPFNLKFNLGRLD